MESFKISVLSISLLLTISINAFPHQMKNFDEDLRVDKNVLKNLNNFVQDNKINTKYTITGERVSHWNLNAAVNPEELGEYMHGDLKFKVRNRRNGVRNPIYKWPNGRVPYIIMNSFNNYQKNMILYAMEGFRLLTCVQFIPRGTENDFLVIQSDKDGCWSSFIGRSTGVQFVNLQIPQCITMVGDIMHELMHVIGFWHEQSRVDRDNYVNILWNNILYNKTDNFYKMDSIRSDTYGIDYDFDSIMHYSPSAFSHNGFPTIQVKQGQNGKMGQRFGFSYWDIFKINRMYC